MTERTYEVFAEEQGSPIKMWTRGVPIDDGARAQLKLTARMPFIHKWLAVMPDVHKGIGSAVGSVVPTKGAIIPAAVGVDIGCGMMAVRTNLTASDLPDSLLELRTAIEAAVPHGRSVSRRKRDRGAWGKPPARTAPRPPTPCPRRRICAAPNATRSCSGKTKLASSVKPLLPPTRRNTGC